MQLEEHTSAAFQRIRPDAINALHLVSQNTRDRLSNWGLPYILPACMNARNNVV